MPGGLAVSTVFATAGFAAVSGASVATAAVFARIAIPEMLKRVYSKKNSAGVVAAGYTPSLIPPSAILVICTIIVEQDVDFFSWFIPGAVSSLVWGINRLHNIISKCWIQWWFTWKALVSLRHFQQLQ